MALLAQNKLKLNESEGTIAMHTEEKVIQKKLSNGLTVLIRTVKNAPKVALQMWYHVGSKDEQPGEKGMAHFIEHMVFKGTEEKLSESDIIAVSQKLSAYINAFTSYDYTAYVFDVPVANWKQVLPIFADCMQHCKFDSEHMNSEVKAVIQELKMYKDHNLWSLREALTPVIFEEHPYHYPIIGYKQDLWSLHRDTLIKFYKKYYVPNNATLVIVGDVNPEEVFQEVKKEFEAIPQGSDNLHRQYFINDSLQSKTVKLYRDVEQPLVEFAFLIPGFKEKESFFFDIIACLLAQGKGSRLYKILVDELQLATSVDAHKDDMQDRDVFAIIVQPKDAKDIDRIKAVILDQIYDLSYNPIAQSEFRRALKFAQIAREHLFESVHDQAVAIGHSYTILKDKEYPFNCSDVPEAQVHEKVVKYLKEYFRPSLCHQAEMLKLCDQDRDYYNRLQHQSDELDTQILFGKERCSEIECERYAPTVQVLRYQKKSFPKPNEKILKNGLKVLFYDNPDNELIEIAVQYKADHIFDPESEQGLSAMVSKLLIEGTKKYSGGMLVKEADSYGIGIHATPGMISLTCLAQDLEKAFELLYEMLNNAELKEKDLEKIISNTQADLIRYWDTPFQSIDQVAAEHIYKNHPYGFMQTGTAQTLKNITQTKCAEFYKNKLTADQACLAIVGNLQKCNIESLLEKYCASWRNTPVVDVIFSAIEPIKPCVITLEKNRDQVALAFAGLSVSRTNPDYDTLLIFNQILFGGMSSRLFEIREGTGLFYTYKGSLFERAAEQPGMIFIKTIVSKDRLQEAEKVIAECLNTAVDTITEEEFEQAKEVIINSFPMRFETNEKTAATFLFLEKYHLSNDYFENRIDNIRALTLQNLKAVGKKYVGTDKLFTVKIGRI